MRDAFRGYYPPNDQQINEIWERCIFSLDASILLNIYRYSVETTQQTFFRILNELNSRIWITHQAAHEYQRGRLGVIEAQQTQVYEDAKGYVNRFLRQVRDSLPRIHAHLNRDALMAILEPSVSTVLQNVDEAKKKHASWKPDELHEQLTNLLQGRVGAEYALADLEQYHKEAEQRYRMQVPPGFQDKAKAAPERYGDYLIWRQLIDHAKELKDKPIIFVTDDGKEDWWHIQDGKTLGPRPELIQEFYTHTNLQFHIYSGETFIERALSFLGSRIELKAEDRAKAVDEARLVTEEGISETIELPLAVPINDSTWIERSGRIHFKNGRHADVEIDGAALPRSYSENGITMDYYIFERLDGTKGRWKGDIARHCVRDGRLVSSDLVATNADIVFPKEMKGSTDG